MAIEKTMHPDIKVSSKVNYIESESKPDDGYYFFAYTIYIKNSGEATAQLLSRHWHITDAFGNVEEVRGNGVVGMQPKIPPSSTFKYDSACPLSTKTGTMKGSYTFITDTGETFEVEIPEFFLIAPSALH